MPRRARLHLDNVPLHIVQRGHNREPRCYAEEDYRSYLHCSVRRRLQRGNLRVCPSVSRKMDQIYCASSEGWCIQRETVPPG